MKCERQKPGTFWVNFGKRGAASGMSLSVLIDGLKPEATAVRNFIIKGYEAEEKRRAKAIKSTPGPVAYEGELGNLFKRR